MREIGRKGGRARSLAKRLAAQKNGKKRSRQPSAATLEGQRSAECASKDTPKSGFAKP